MNVSPLSFSKDLLLMLYTINESVHLIVFDGHGAIQTFIDNRFYHMHAWQFNIGIPAAAKSSCSKVCMGKVVGMGYKICLYSVLSFFQNKPYIIHIHSLESIKHS